MHTYIPAYKNSGDLPVRPTPFSVMAEVQNVGGEDSLKLNHELPSNTAQGTAVVGRPPVDRADSLAPTKDDEDEQLSKELNRVDVNADTVVTPTKLTLLFSKDTPASFTDYFPHPPVKKFLSGESLTLGRGEDTDVVLNSDKMSREYGQINHINNDISTFVVKNISSTKLIEVLYSKGKKRMCHKLKYGEEMEIRTNYILKFHILEFRVIVEPGDVSSDYYELEVTQESDKQEDDVTNNISLSSARNQPMVVNNGQLYIANRDMVTKTGSVNTSMSTKGSSVMTFGPKVNTQRNQTQTDASQYCGPSGNQEQPFLPNPHLGQSGYDRAGPGNPMGPQGNKMNNGPTGPHVNPQENYQGYNYSFPSGHPMPGYPQMNTGFPMGHNGQFIHGGYQMGNVCPSPNAFGPTTNPAYPIMGMPHAEPPNAYMYGGNPQNFNFPTNPGNGMGYRMQGKYPVKVNNEGSSSFCPTPHGRSSDNRFYYPVFQETGPWQENDSLKAPLYYQNTGGDSVPAKGVRGDSNIVCHPVENSEEPDPIARLVQKADP